MITIMHTKKIFKLEIKSQKSSKKPKLLQQPLFKRMQHCPTLFSCILGLIAILIIFKKSHSCMCFSAKLDSNSYPYLSIIV